MKLKKRSKRSRIRGRRTIGYGSRKKHRGKGSKGGKGMAGTGKFAGQKLTYLLRYYPDYLGKRGFKSLKKLKKHFEEINLEDIDKKIETFMKEGIAQQVKDNLEITLKNHKVLSRGALENIKKKYHGFTIKAQGFSKKAEEKIKEAGGVVVRL